MFTAFQYETALADLAAAKTQLVADANPCAVCGDGSHMAFECGFNPLVAMRLARLAADKAFAAHFSLHAHEEGLSRVACEAEGCKEGYVLGKGADGEPEACDACNGDGFTDPVPDEVHNLLHWLAGFDQAFGVQLGPARVIMPAASLEEI